MFVLSVRLSSRALCVCVCVCVCACTLRVSLVCRIYVRTNTLMLTLLVLPLARYSSPLSFLHLPPSLSSYSSSSSSFSFPLSFPLSVHISHTVSHKKKMSAAKAAAAAKTKAATVARNLARQSAVQAVASPGVLETGLFKTNAPPPPSPPLSLHLSSSFSSIFLYNHSLFVAAVLACLKNFERLRKKQGRGAAVVRVGRLRRSGRVLAMQAARLRRQPLQNQSGDSHRVSLSGECVCGTHRAINLLLFLLFSPPSPSPTLTHACTLPPSFRPPRFLPCLGRGLNRLKAKTLQPQTSGKRL